MEGKITPFIIGLIGGVLIAVAWPHVVGSTGSSPTSKPSAAIPTAPGVTETLISQNDKVRIIRFHFEPGAIIPMHHAPDVVATWLDDGHFKLTHPDGSAQDMHVKAGQTQWFDAQDHTGENLAKTPLDFVVTQMKQ